MTIARKLTPAALIFILGLLGGYYFAAHRLRNATVSSRAAAKLGPWQVIFKLPATFRVPLENPVLTLEVKKPESIQPDTSDHLKLTITNLASRAISVQLTVYGYDSRNFRVGGDIERFPIPSNETLSKDLEISTYLGAGGTLGLPPTQMPSSYALSLEMAE